MWALEPWSGFYTSLHKDWLELRDNTPPPSSNLDFIKTSQDIVSDLCLSKYTSSEYKEQTFTEGDLDVSIGANDFIGLASVGAVLQSLVTGAAIELNDVNVWEWNKWSLFKANTWPGFVSSFFF